MSEDLVDSTETGQTTERPTFLTVLCILTWVGSGYGIISTLMNMGGAASGIIPSWYSILVILLNVVTAYAAYMMWNLKKQGLMIYTAAEGLGIILPFVLIYGIFGSNSAMANLMGSMLLIATLFPIAFIIMYWANAKHLND